MKRIISLLLALLICLFSCAQQEGADSQSTHTDASGDTVHNGTVTPDPDGGISVDEDSDIAKLFDAIANTLKQDNVTLVIDLGESAGEGIPKVDVKVDLKDSSFTFAYDETYRGNTTHYVCGYDDKKFYESMQTDKGLPYGSVYDTTGDGSTSALGMLTAVFEDHSKLTPQNVINLIAGTIFGVRVVNPNGSSDTVDTDEPTLNPIQYITEYVMKSLSDEKWVCDLAGLSVARDGATETYTISPDVYGIANDLLSYLEDKVDAETLAEAKKDIEDEKDSINTAKIVCTVEVTNGLLTKAQLSTDLSGSGKQESINSREAPAVSQNGMLTHTFTLTFSDYGKTSVGIDELKKTLYDAHNGHEECVRCGERVYASCYCNSCAYQLLCVNFCGNPRPENGEYCSDCYTPCKDCGQRHGKYSGYCYDCYKTHFCDNDCGNAVTHFEGDYGYGYCDDCYAPCPDCGMQGDEYNRGYCYSCVAKHYCYECRKNPIAHTIEDRGYCSDCYAPCPDCGKQGDEYHNGYCYNCFSSKFCGVCRKNPITHPSEYDIGYCDDCFMPCKGCGEHTGSYSLDYKGYCYDCFYDIYCAECREKEITHRPEDSYDGYCDDCYTECSECGAHMRKIKDVQCYECYYNTYCHECGKNPIATGSGHEHKLCADCNK